MAIDIRATVTCSLGTLISGSISDDYIQGSGLVKTRGNVEISALITPAIGTEVTFSYVKDGVTRSIPRKLRVLSSFADPFRRTTKVELGCKLSYLSDLKEAVDWSAFDDPENAGYDEDDARIVTLPIHASSVMNQCLTQLGITASSNPLTNKFSIAAFDFSAGYVQVLSDLLVSESYCGYLDTNEVLQVFNLDQNAGTGPVFTSADIVDLGPIGVGQLPGEAVTVSYSTLKLKAPDPDADEELINWERTDSNSRATVVISYGENQTRVYTGVEYNTQVTNYEVITIKQDGKDGKKEVPIKRTTTESRLNASVAGSLITQYLNAGFNFNAGPVEGRSEEYYTYDAQGNEIQRTTLRYRSALEIVGQVGLPLVFSSEDFLQVPSGEDRYLAEKIITKTTTIGEYTRTETSVFGLWNESIPGQQTIAESRDSFTTSAAVASYISATLNGDLILLNESVESRRTGRITSEERPSGADRINGAYAKDGDPNNGWRTESKADLELAVGSATAQRRIELSMPYAPDDTFKELINPLTGLGLGVFTSEASDAPAKANRYGRVQNRLLLGNRSGINLQLAPERLPAAPYSPLYVQASGLTALYRANGTNWAFDSNGIVCSVDALFWAAVGGTGTFWFPVAPGITTLPAEPAIVDGAMTATSTILPYNETAIYDSRIRLTTAVTKFDYSLELLTELTSEIQVPAEVVKVTPIHMPAPAAFTIAAAAPRIDSSVDVRVVTTPDITIEAKVPQVGSGIGLVIDPPAIDIALAAPAPAFALGSTISLLLHMDGTNGSTTFTDSSLNTLTVTANGNAQISTAQSKFGGASALFDGTGDYLSINSSEVALATSDHTVEAWIRLNALPSTRWGISYNGDPTSNNNRVQFEVTPTGAVVLFLQAGTGTGVSFTSTTTLSTGTWYHVAYAKSGNNVYVFIDGVLEASGTYSTSISTNNNFYVGLTRSANTTWSLDGYLDDLRVTKGIARYTANFTPPTTAFPDP